MKICYLNNPSVDYTEVFESWIKSTLGPSDVFQQGPSLQTLIELKPDVIVINDMTFASAEQTFYYKSFFPETKTIVICHAWKQLQTVNEKTAEVFEGITNHLFIQTAKQANNVFVLNIKPDWIQYKDQDLENKVLNRYHPIDDDIFKIKVSWWDRPKIFGYFGDICPLNFSHEFLKKNRVVEMDLYGRREFKQKEMSYPLFNRDLDSNKCLIYKGIVPQEQMSDVLNSYKFFVLPHSGEETFNITLLQAIKCGAIPLVVRKGTWLHWAKDMHLAVGDEDKLIQKMIEIKQGFPDLTPYSETISDMAKEKYGYDKFMQEFQGILESSNEK